MQLSAITAILCKRLTKANTLTLSKRLELVLYHSRGDLETPPRISMPNRDLSVDPHVARSNSLITKLSKQGKIIEAQKMFDEMRKRDVVTWTAVISGYINCGLIDEARKLFDRDDAAKNVITWTAMVGGYLKANRVAEAESLFEAMPERNVVSWNTMVAGYVQEGEIDKALCLFERMPEKNVVSWNLVITGLVQFGRVEEAKRLFDEMPSKDVVSWTSMCSGLASNGWIAEARVVFERMPEKNVVSWNAMINGYAKNRMLGEAFKLFERMPERSVSSWNTMITGFLQNGELVRARMVFDEMPGKNVVSWTTMITGYVQAGESEDALEVFVEMIRSGGAKPNEGTFVNCLGACSDLAGLWEGEQVHQMICKSVYQDTLFVKSALICMYSKCGELGAARKIFDVGKTSQRDLVFWNGMIAAYAHHGYGKEAVALFEEMRSLGVKPNDVSYLGLLFACSHAGLVEEGLKYFDELVRDGSIEIREDHHTCLIDLCVRAGKLIEISHLLKQLGNKPLSSVWCPFIAGCNIHGNLELGKLAAKELIVINKEPENAGICALLSNMYASCGKWGEAARVRLKMKDKGLKKQPGCSWIQIGSSVHVFLVHDVSHSVCKDIYLLLHDLHAKMRMAGYRRNADYQEDSRAFFGIVS